MIGGHIKHPSFHKQAPNTAIFNNPVWNARRDGIAGRVARQQALAHAHHGSGYRRTQKIKKRGYKKQVPYQ